MPRGQLVKIGSEFVDGMLYGRQAAISDWLARKEQQAFRRLVHRLEVKRWEKRNPAHAARLHRAASAAWERRHPEAAKASRARRKKRYCERHPDRVKAANRRAYLLWKAKPGNMEKARVRAATRRNELATRRREP